MNADEILTKGELAKLLKVGIRTIDRMRNEGMPSFKIGSGIRFQKEKVLKWIEENQSKN